MHLYVDDVRDCPYVGFETVRTVEAAMRALATDTVERCSLDHDMGACEACTAIGAHEGACTDASNTFMNWCPHAMDGTKLVRWMIETGHWPHVKPLVHSANPMGRERMRTLIDMYFGKPAFGPMF